MTLLILVTVLVASILFVTLPRRIPIFVRHECWSAVAALIVIYLGTEATFWRVHSKEWPGFDNWLGFVIPTSAIIAATSAVSSKRSFDGAFATLICIVCVSIQFGISGNVGVGLAVAGATCVTMAIVCFMQIPTLEIEPSTRLCQEPLIASIACAAFIVIATTIVHADANRQLTSVGIPLIGLGLFGLMVRAVTIFRLLSIQIISLGMVSLVGSYGVENGWQNAFSILCFTLGASAVYSFVLSSAENSLDVFRFEGHPILPKAEQFERQPALNAEDEIGVSS